jgi:hypothetical protein
MRSGKTGSGKSYDAVLTAYMYWRNGMDVWSNTPLFFTNFNQGQGGENIKDNPEYFTILEKGVEIIRSIFLSNARKKKKGIKRRGRISYFDTIDETFHLKNTVILFDEGQTLFRSYDWESVPRLFLQKVEQNRKHENHLITTAQRVKAVNINYRELIQDWIHFETIFDLFGFHIYRAKIKDIDYITENMQEADIPTLRTKGLLGFKVLKPWTRRLYDTMYDIGFEPLQHYKIIMGNEKVKLHLESGMTVKEALSKISLYKKALEL